MSGLVSDSDQWGMMYIQIKERTPDSYYERLEDIKPLLRDTSFMKLVTGYYLNIKTKDSRDWLRLSFFSLDAFRAMPYLMEYLHERKINPHPTEVDIRKTISLSAKYGCPDLELPFRKYLTDSTQIGLDLIEFDVVEARRLMLWLRYRVIAGSLNVKEHIEPSFLVMSDYYHTMSAGQRKEFLEDLVRKPSPEESDWAHFIYNFVSGLPDTSGVRGRFGGESWPIKAINNRVKSLGDTSLYLPDSWTPFEPRD